jgi:hypothetical protein
VGLSLQKIRIDQAREEHTYVEHIGGTLASEPQTVLDARECKAVVFETLQQPREV